jgi:hypothetical protein
MGFTKQNKKKIMKRNEILLLTKQNETKFRCFYCFAKQAKFRETNFLFRFVSCFAKQKKGCEMEIINMCSLWPVQLFIYTYALSALL